MPSWAWSPTLQMNSERPGASRTEPDRARPAENAGVPPSSLRPFTTRRSWASVPRLSRVIFSAPPPPVTTTVAGSNEYSRATIRSPLFAATVSERLFAGCSSLPQAPATMNAHMARAGARRRIGRRIICRAVTRLAAFAVTAAAALSLLAAGCGGNITVPKKDTASRQGAQLFYERCSGCHSIDAANAYGSKPTGQISPGERTNGPNFNIRKESRDDVLFAIRNGGFSGAIMPANVVVGHDAQLVADFLSNYSGRKSPSNETNPGIKNQP